MESLVTPDDVTIPADAPGIRNEENLYGIGWYLREMES